MTMDDDPMFDEIYKIFFGDDRQPSEEVAQLTEAQWRSSGDPRRLLDFLRGKISNRQLNLFGVACCRRAWNLLAPPSQAAIEATERFVDGQLSEDDLHAVGQAAINIQVGLMAREMELTDAESSGSPDEQEPAVINRLSAAAAAVTYGMCSSPLIGTYTADAPMDCRGMMALVTHAALAVTGNATDPAEYSRQCDFLRDIVGNPFHPVTLDPSWQTSTVLPLAQAIYAEKTFDQMPSLADALEKAGYSNADLLGHCRGPGPHVRGCRVLDLLLAGHCPAHAPSATVEDVLAERKKQERDEYPVVANERCYRCRFRCSACGPRFILLYGPDGETPQLQGCPFCEFGNPTVTVDRQEPFGEAEWLAGDDLEAMCRWVDDHFGGPRIGRLGVPVFRKARLFACHCCHVLWLALTHPDSRAAVEVAESFAERTATRQELKSAFNKANAAAWGTGNNDDPAWAANNAALETPYVQSAADHLLAYVKSEPNGQRAEQLIATWLRDIFGNPFHPPTVDPAWQTGTVVSLAQTIYDDRAFDCLPILADALEEAGCTDPDILSHCRGQGPHVQGCFLLDLLLKKE
jgi:hypothetical protein